MKNPRKKNIKRRLPLEAVLRLRSHPVASQKGEKGYNRKKVKERNRKIPGEDIFEQNH
jgi:hypothetical protein